MNEYVCKHGEFSGSDYLEFRKGNSGAGRKFLRQDSLYVLDSAFFFFLERIFREIITSFDMFEDRLQIYPSIICHIQWSGANVSVPVSAVWRHLMLLQSALRRGFV